MRNALNLAAGIVFAAGALVYGQSGDANKVLADAREALGGEKKLSALKTMTVIGRTQRTNAAGTTTENEFELALELPDKLFRRDVLVPMGTMSVYRNSGFNGEGLINEIDRPPQLAGGGVMQMRIAGPGDAGRGGPGATPPTPEMQAAMRKGMVLNSKQELTRLTLGMFAQSLAAYPVTFTHGGQAESADGKADIIDVKGEGDFAVRLFIDTQTHLPLMISWMAKEPMTVTRGPGGTTTVAPGMTTMVMGGGGGPVMGHAPAGAPPPPPPPPPGGSAAAPAQGRPTMTPEEREKMKKDMEERMKNMEEQMKEVEAKRKVVEYRLFYSDYKEVNGLMVPHKFQRSIAGKPTEEVTFDKVKINPKIDAKKFEVTKEKS